MLFFSRDNIISKTCNSTCGTFESSSPEGKPLKNLSTIYSTVREVPDVIGYSSSMNTSACSRTQSENGSASDINELFCTLPRKRDLGRYRSSDSQTALLTGSASSSSDSFSRRLSIEMQRLGLATTNRRNVLKSHQSGSLLNLSEKPTNLSSTPLLDVRNLEARLSPHPKKEVSSTVANPYDYHAAQLEKFLEEYRVLQKQLTKMKQTCDSICQEQGRDVLPPCTSASNPSNQVNSPNSNSIQDSVDFKNFENELTKYLMSRSPSTSAKNFPSTALHN